MCALVSFLTHPRLYFGFLIPLIRWYIFKVKVFILCLSSLYLLNYHYLVFKALMLLLSSFSRVRLFSDPIDLPRPWDSPGKNTGVGCHLLQCMKVKSESEVAQSCLTLQRPHGLKPTRLLRPWDFPGKSTGVGCHCLLRRPLYIWLTPPIQ